MSYAEHNRRLLLQYDPDECILKTIDKPIFTALQAGRRVSPKHSDNYKLVMTVLVAVTGIFGVGLILSAEAVTRPLLVVLAIGFLLFVLATARNHFERTFSDLNRLWVESKLLTTQDVEIGKPSDPEDFTHGVMCRFTAPDGKIITEHFDTSIILQRAKTQLRHSGGLP